MSSRPVCKIIPSAKLTADNAGDVELSAHRRAITATSAALQPQSIPSSLSDPLEPTSAVATGTASDQDHQVTPSLAPTKRPRARPILPTTSLETLVDDTEPDDTPKVKKAKVTSCQAESGVTVHRTDSDYPFSLPLRRSNSHPVPSLSSLSSCWPADISICVVVACIP
jgi:hypothetical protein